jgi:hypothetical protein
MEHIKASRTSGLPAQTAVAQGISAPSPVLSPKKNVVVKKVRFEL